MDSPFWTTPFAHLFTAAPRLAEDYDSLLPERFFQDVGTRTRDAMILARGCLYALASLEESLVETPFNPPRGIGFPPWDPFSLKVPKASLSVPQSIPPLMLPDSARGRRICSLEDSWQHRFEADCLCLAVFPLFLLRMISKCCILPNP